MLPRLACLLASLAILADADVYIHNPRGSNNRLNGRGRNRSNGNRLFDSQNNARGGYNVGTDSMTYYEGSNLQVEWTSQHSCGGPNNHCEMVLQYMCGENVRDGTTEQTPPESTQASKQPQFGQHEPYEYYKLCRKTQRNKGLFTADQNMNGRNAARNTRQNRNGNRRGYECPEERDYYPYWRPSPWVDVAVLTNEPRRCDYYRQESVKPRGQCVFDNLNDLPDGSLPIKEDDCKAYSRNGVSARWEVIEPPKDAPKLDCRQTEESRDNHNGNGPDGEPLTYNWTIPSADLMKGNCVLRMRYNISTGDYKAWDDSVNSKDNNRNRKQPGLKLPERLGFKTQEEAAERGYVFKNNPNVQIFKEIENLKLQLAINTAQYGRTFEDRSHVFNVKDRDADKIPEDSKIHNVNVRGKRGNIVQVYPAVEYDFVPNSFTVAKGDYLHFQWTGADTNPQNNDGEGTRGTDRSNVILQRELGFEKVGGNVSNDVHGWWGSSFPASLATSKLLGFDYETQKDLALVGVKNPGPKLNDAPGYYDAGAIQVTETGAYHYLCTRNNNFSNRQQKGRILVIEGGIDELEVGKRGVDFTTADGRVSISIPENVFNTVVKLRLQTSLTAAASLGAPPHFPLSEFISLTPADLKVKTPMKMSVQLDAATIGDKIPHVMVNMGAKWEKVDSVYSEDVKVIEFLLTSGGVYYVAEGGDAMPPPPPPTEPAKLSKADQLLDRICELFQDGAKECREDVKAMQDRGLDNLYIGKKLLVEFEEMVDEVMEDDVFTPAKRELLGEILKMFENKVKSAASINH